MKQLGETVLVTFLGRTRNIGSSYQTTRYQIEGEIYREASLLGYTLCWALAPQRLVVLGTSGSRWDQLFDTDLNFGEREFEARLALSDAAQSGVVTQEQLKQLQPMLADKLKIDVQLELVPTGLTTQDQVALVKCMADQVKRGDQVHLDVTHGLRSTPMLGLLAAMYLREVSEVHIEGIWYGAHELAHEAVTPVINLSGLLQIADWVSAMSSYRQDGDYGVFAPLLGDGAHLLKEAAFFERVNNTASAKQKLETWSQTEIDRDNPVAALFAPELERRLSWYRKPTRHEREQHLAREYLKRGDYLRASILGLEGLISAEAYRLKLNPDTVAARDESSENLSRLKSEYRELNKLRNTVAHGSQNQDKSIRKSLKTRQKLEEKLKQLFRSLRIGS